MSIDKDCRNSAVEIDLYIRAAADFFRRRFRQWCSDPDLCDELVAAALERLWEALQRKDSAHISLSQLAEWTWCDYWRRRYRERNQEAFSLDAPLGEDGPAVIEVLGSSPLGQLVRALLDEDTLRIFEDLAAVGRNWSELGRRWNCDPRTAKRRVRERLSRSLDQIAPLCGYADGKALLYGLRDSRVVGVPKEIKREMRKKAEVEGNEDQSRT